MLALFVINEIYQKCAVPDPTNQGLGYILTLDCIPPLVANLILWALIFAGTVALIFIIFSGIKFITSGGDPKQTEGARKTLTFAIAGLVLILLSFAILRFIADITNLGCITKFGFTSCEEKIKVIEPKCTLHSDCPLPSQRCMAGKCREG